MPQAQPKLSPEEEAQREDEQVLAQTERDIEEIMGLIGDKTDRAGAEKRLAEAEEWVEEKREGPVFHQHNKGNRKIPLKHHTSNLFKLTDALKLSMQAKRHGADLHRALDNHLRHMVKVQRRIMKRGLF